MSQQLVSMTGGVSKVETSATSKAPLVLSTQFIDANNLHSRPTEWVPGGRPIYRRLPASSETYQIDFFYVVDAANTATQDVEQDIGYVYVPWGESIDGAKSMRVSSSANKQDLIIQSGNIVWKYGTNPTIPVLVNLKEIGVTSGKYTVAYELLYDDSPVLNQYEVTDFSLSGYPLVITSDTDNSPGWRYLAENAFLTTGAVWRNQDTLLPSYVQPTSTYLAWESELPSAYSKVTLTCPSDFVCPANVYAQLSYREENNWAVEIRSYVKRSSTGFYFEINPDKVIFMNGWKVEWYQGDIEDLNPAPYLDMVVQSVSVSGTVTLPTKPSNPSTRAALVMYPENLLPATVTNSSNEQVAATYCPLANVDVNNNYEVISIRDLRYVIHRDYQPVSDWLTKPFDDDLISLYEQVKGYSTVWMSPTECLKQEYLGLGKELIVIE